MAAIPRRPPPGSQNDPPPPSLPPRPARGGGALRPTPTPVARHSDNDSDPEDYIQPLGSTDDGPDEVYDDCHEDSHPPPPLPPHPSRPPLPQPDDPQDLYDDFEASPALPDPPDVEEIYDDCEDNGPVVQQLPKKPERQERSLPRLPPVTPAPPQKESVYEINPDVPEVPPAPLQVDDTYEVGDDDVSPLPPPPPPQRDNKKPESRPSAPHKASAAPTMAPGGIFIDPGQLSNMKNNLRKISSSEKPLERQNSAQDPKEYGDIGTTVSEVRKKLESKADAKPGISPKPALVPKSGALKPPKSAGSSSPLTNGNSGITARKNKPVPKPSSPAEEEQSTSDVTFLHKTSKENKHTNVPLPPVPTPQQPPKAVFKAEPKPEEILPPEDIYDDAFSGDVMDKYDWYHGIIDRTTGESRVKSVGKDGTYLVRVSAKDPTFPYTLVVLHKGHVNNLRIRKRQKDSKFALGDEKSDELAFPDVPAMINHHKNHHVVLLGNNQSQVKLQHTPHKG